MKINKHNYFALALWFYSLISCVEEIPVVTEAEFESALVVEAIITNENKQQEIKLSRAYRLETDGSFPELGATVNLLASNGNSFSFQESAQSGLYLSNAVFSALPDIEYQLEITTADGRSYGSDLRQLTPEVAIDNLYVERNLNENDKEGISVFVDASGSDTEPVYYRYEYEETYKVIAPLYSPLELVILNDDFDYTQNFFASNTLEEIINFFFEVRTRPQQEQICYNTVNSNNIILASTDDLTNNNLDSFRIRFIGRDNYIISHRYSILVKQYIQSLEGHTYYKTLNNFSNSENIFSETQLGFLQGNVFSVTSPEERVVGFFEVSSVNKQRLYFNYADLFSGEQLPPYIVECDDFIEPILLKEDFVHNIIGSPVIDDLRGGWVLYDVTNDTNPSYLAVRPYTLVLQVCGDCTVLGENVVPDFWEE